MVLVLEPPSLLSEDTIQARLEALCPQPTYRYVRPFYESAETYIDYAANPFGRFQLGLPEIDAMIRGFGNGELCYVTGRPHSGKTQVVLNAVNNNRSKRVLFFTPDEPAELVLSKLVALRMGAGADKLEEQVRNGDKQTQRLIRDVAKNDFANLIVIDEPLTLGQMHDAVKEAEDYFGNQIDCAVVDFLELILGEGREPERVDIKSQAVKRWAKDIDRPVICMHQAKRGNRGVAVGMDDMRYGGDMDAIYVLGVWRKRDDESLDSWDRQRAWDTVTVGVSKNKRPPCKKGEHDYYLDAATGRIGTVEPIGTRQLRDVLRVL